MITSPTYLKNYEAVMDAFGYWPSFHDGEVRSLLMDRNQILFGKIANARIELKIHGWEMTGEVNEKGYFKLIKHHIVHFEFSDVREVKLADFNHQNAVFGLDFTELANDVAGNSSFKVTLNPANGLDGEFVAMSGRVVSVMPCDEKGNLVAEG